MILLDAGVLVAYEVEDDANHEKAAALLMDAARGIFGRVFTSDYIFDEILTVTFVRTKSLSKAVLAGSYIKDSMDILKVDESTFEGAWGLFKNQKGTRFSFTDCTTISLMRERNIENIATFDGEFKKVKDINIIGP